MTHRPYAIRIAFVCTTLPALVAGYLGCGGGSTNATSGDGGGGGGVPGGYCGDGVVNVGEQCDFGMGKNLPGSGCESNCQFSCTTNPDSCSNSNPCAGTEKCSSVTGPNGDMGQKCASGAPPADGTSCGANGLVCKGGQCTSANCGNNNLDPGEQCDDGNTRDLDGCDSRCNYEVVMRMNSMAIAGSAAPSYCTPTTNTLGTKTLTAFSTPILNSTVTNDIDAGTLNVTTQFLGLSDLTGGASQSSGLSVGILNSKLDPAKGTWPNQSPIDWWFLADSTTVSDGLPTSTVTATLSNRQLTAGPADVTLTLVLGGQPAPLELRGAHLVATLDGTPAPNVPAPPPAKLASGVTVLQQITGNGANQGLCGNITVESLAQVPVPQMLAQGGTHACLTACPGSQVYTYCGMGMPVGPNCNSLLDVLVGGCNVATSAALCGLSAVTEVVNPTQPDVPASGSTSKTLSLGASNKIPASQTSGNKDAFSAFMTFTGNRAHFTSQTCTQNTDCQTGLSCQSGVCK